MASTNANDSDQPLRLVYDSVHGAVHDSVTDARRIADRPDPEQAQLAFLHQMDEWHREQGHELCYCSRWVHPDDLYEGTCGGVDCLRAEQQDRMGLVP